jgi:hypothetical protein
VFSADPRRRPVGRPVDVAPTPSPRPVPAWLLVPVVVGWVVLWTLVACGVWQNAVADRTLSRDGHQVAGVVVSAGPMSKVKLDLCRQPLRVEPRTGAHAGSAVSLVAVRGCERPWTVGEQVDVTVQPNDPARAVLRSTVVTPVQTYLVQVLFVALAAIAAGWLPGRVLAEVRERRFRAWWERLGR